MTPLLPTGLTAAAMLLLLATLALANQVVFSHGVQHPDHSGPSVPHRWFSEHDVRSIGDDSTPPAGMELIPLSVRGENKDRVNIAIFGDGYTATEKDKFLTDIQKLSGDIVGEGGAMANVSDLVNVWGVWVESAKSGLGHDAPNVGAPFGLYREGATLRGVIPAYTRRARAACTYWRQQRDACDQAVLLGNDDLYGGLGGEFTVTTSSPANSVIVTRHELGHSLIKVGEEYDGGPGTYFGANSDELYSVNNLKWKEFLTDPNPVIQDAKIALQSYTWHNLNTSWQGSFASSNTEMDSQAYNNSMLRLSLSSIPQPDHVNVTLNGAEIDLAPGFLPEMNNSKDRRWVEIFLTHPLPVGDSSLVIELTAKGREAEEGQGGKMVTSVEVIQYGRSFIKEEGFVGAFPTTWDNGRITLRPTNEECLMRKVNYPRFCVVCQDSLRKHLLAQIAQKHNQVGAFGTFWH